MQDVLTLATQDSDNPDLRDRGYIYWRLLSTDPEAAKQVVLAEKPNEPTGVMLAHHAGDVVENVLSNSMRGSSVLALAGMAPEGVVEGVRVWRPWLAHDKSEIFAFARRCAAASGNNSLRRCGRWAGSLIRYGVPWLKDSTPAWSTRGRLRENLLPCLRDTYGDGAEMDLLPASQGGRRAR